MFSDPLFLLASIGILTCLVIWVLEAIKMDNTSILDIQTPSQSKLSKIGFVFGLLILYSVFINAGDLSIILLLATIVSLVIWITGKFIGNSYLKSSGRSWFIPIFLIFVLRTFMYEPYQIPSGSMIPGLKVGDFILVNKHSYGLKIERTGKSFAMAKDPEFGDVVVFIPPHKPMPFVKRLIGKPGDKISYINKKLYLNDTAVPQNYYKTESGIDFYLPAGLAHGVQGIKVVGVLGLLHHGEVVRHKNRVKPIRLKALHVHGRSVSAVTRDAQKPHQTLLFRFNQRL